jgi:plastocyanin
MARPTVPVWLLACAAACGGGSGDEGAAPLQGGAATFTCGTIAEVSITAAGFQPAAVSVPGGGCVRFTNADGAPHQPASDPHLAHTDCPELNVAAPLAAGADVTAKLRSGPKSCGFHDHLHPPPSAWAGAVSVTGVTPGGDPQGVDPPGRY